MWTLVQLLRYFPRARLELLVRKHFVDYAQVKRSLGIKLLSHQQKIPCAVYAQQFFPNSLNAITWHDVVRREVHDIGKGRIVRAERNIAGQGKGWKRGHRPVDGCDHRSFDSQDIFHDLASFVVDARDIVAISAEG